jgi:hypothetical protein
MRRSKAILVLVVGCIAVNCSVNYRGANQVAVEKLRQQLIAERFDEIYRDSSGITRASMTSDEFANEMTAATEWLKDLDPELRWRRDERGSPEEAVYRDDNWSSLILEGKGKGVVVHLWWGESFKLCGFEIGGDVPEGGRRVFRTCD